MAKKRQNSRAIACGLPAATQVALITANADRPGGLSHKQNRDGGDRIRSAPSHDLGYLNLQVRPG